MTIAQQAYKDLGYAQIAAGGLTTATALPNIPAGCRLVTIIAEGQAVRWRSDGTDPTASVGYPVQVNVEQSYDAEQISRIKFIQQAANATLNIQYWG